jgi:heat shock protein HtpX
LQFLPSGLTWRLEASVGLDTKEHMNGFKTVLLLGALTGLFLFLGETFGGQQGMFFALIVAVVMNFASYFFSDKIALASYGATPVSREQAPEFYATVERLAQKAGIPMPRLYVIPSPALNAFATGRNPAHAAVAATEGILRAMSPEELEGVIGHELSHVLNRDILTSSVAATLGGAISFLSRELLWFGGGRRDDRDSGSPLLGLFALIAAPIAAMLIQLMVSRSREYEADASGARLVGYPQGLISALRKLEAAAGEIPLAGAVPATAHLCIVNPLRGGGLSGLFSTHPPLEKRIARLMEMGR